MKEIWTVQSKKVVKKILADGVYYPDIKLARKYYGDMRCVYPLILEKYKKENQGKEENINNIQGIIFGFGNVGNKNINNIQDLYSFFVNRGDISMAFNFWNSNYCILRLEVPENINLIDIDFNDFIMISIEITNDISRKVMLENNVLGCPLNIYLTKVLNNLGTGKVSPAIKSFTQIHYSHLDINNIVDIYPMIDYKSKIIFNLENEFLELKEYLKNK